MAIIRPDREQLDEPARQVIAAAAILADESTGVVVGVLGPITESLASEGADLVAIYDDLDGSRYDPQREVAAVRALMSAYPSKHVFLADDARTGDLGRRLIASLSVDGAANVVEVDGVHVSTRWNGLSGPLAHRALPQIVLLQSGTVDSELPFRGTGRRLSADALPSFSIAPPVCRDLGIETPPASALALEDADLVVSAGYGVTNTGTIDTLAEKLGAAVGASRVAVDEGKYPRDRQIGATGKTISASGYIAIGISGAVQHLQGIKDCRHVIAINKDAGAPIVKRADLTLIGDAEDIMQALITRIGQARAQREIAGSE